MFWLRKKWKAVLISAAIAASVTATAVGLNRILKENRLEKSSIQMIVNEIDGLEKYVEKEMKVKKHLENAEEFKKRAESINDKSESSRDYKIALQQLEEARKITRALALSHDNLGLVLKKIKSSGVHDDELKGIISVHGSVDGFINYLNDKNREITVEIGQKETEIRQKI